jgi:hypothetical protein
MGTSPTYVETAKVWQQQILTGNTNRDGATGTYGTIVTAGSGGSRLTGGRIEGVGTVTAGMIRLFVSDGTNTRLYDERPVTATTPSGTVPGWQDDFSFPESFTLQSGWSLKASTNNAETFNVFAYGGDI